MHALDTVNPHMESVRNPSFLGMRVVHFGDNNCANARDEILTFFDANFIDAGRLEHHVSAEKFQALTDARCLVKKTTSGWLLTQQSRIVSCAVNDAVLLCGDTMEVRKGDRIELGMVRLEVVYDVASSEDVVWMEVTESLEQDLSTQIGAVDPFFNLPRFQYNVHSEVLTSYAGIPEESDVIDALASEYWLSIADPNSLQMRKLEVGDTSRERQLLERSDDLAQQEPAYFSLEDVLSGQATIDQVLDRLGVEDAAWSQVVTPDDVLMLFAGDMQRQEQFRLPGLTLREHHGLSPDSHVSLGRAVEEAQVLVQDGYSGRMPAPTNDDGKHA